MAWAALGPFAQDTATEPPRTPKRGAAGGRAGRAQQRDGPGSPPPSEQMACGGGCSTTVSRFGCAAAFEAPGTQVGGHLNIEGFPPVRKRTFSKPFLHVTIARHGNSSYPETRAHLLPLLDIDRACQAARTLQKGCKRSEACVWYNHAGNAPRWRLPPVQQGLSQE